MYTLVPDHQISRRKRTNHVLDAAGDLAFSASDLLSCLQFLAEAGQYLFQCETNDESSLRLAMIIGDTPPPPSVLRCPDDPI